MNSVGCWVMSPRFFLLSLVVIGLTLIGCLFFPFGFIGFCFWRGFYYDEP